MLSSRMKQFFLLSDMPVLGLFNYHKFFFSTPESADSMDFSGSKALFALQMLRELRNF
jgi:hypothetical protein